MSTLNKKYRLIWDASVVLIDPFLEYESNTVSVTNATGSFQSDEIEDVVVKMGELGLEYETELGEENEEDK